MGAKLGRLKKSDGDKSSPGKDHDPPWVGGEEAREGTGVSDGGSGATAATPSSKPPPGKHLAVIWISAH